VAVSARLTLVDLAGSERIKRTGASGSTLAEAQKINLSLLELGNVIQALSESSEPSVATALASGTAAASRHIPFRNSSLTRLLQESLGGNCRTSLLVCVSPALADASETKGSLQFGARAMRVRQDAVINCQANYQEVAQQLARQLEDKEVVWKRKHERLEAQLAEALACIESLKLAQAHDLDAQRDQAAHALQVAVAAERRGSSAREGALVVELRAVEVQMREATSKLSHAERVLSVLQGEVTEATAAHTSEMEAIACLRRRDEAVAAQAVASAAAACVERMVALGALAVADADCEAAVAAAEACAIEKAVAVAEKCTAVAEKEAAMAEKQVAVAEKETAVAEKETAVAEKETAVAEKEVAMAEKETAIEAGQLAEGAQQATIAANRQKGIAEVRKREDDHIRQLEATRLAAAAVTSAVAAAGAAEESTASSVCVELLCMTLSEAEKDIDGHLSAAREGVAGLKAEQQARQRAQAAADAFEGATKLIQLELDNLRAASKGAAAAAFVASVTTAGLSSLAQSAAMATPHCSPTLAKLKGAPETRFQQASVVPQDTVTIGCQAGGMVDGDSPTTPELVRRGRRRSWASRLCGKSERVVPGGL